jgi:hypothetical protein
MIRVEAVHTFPGSVSEVFGYITSLENWAEYWPGFLHIEDVANARWSQSGDKVTLVFRLLNRDRTLHMELGQFQEDTVVTYRSRQQGLPDAQHERHFRPVPGGVEYRAVVAYEPRKRLRGLYDRLVVKAAVARVLRKTIDSLDKHLKPS